MGASRVFPWMFLLSAISIGIYAVYCLFSDVQDNSCEMTYMYEYPKYIKLDLPKELQKVPQYNLYVYGEGSYAEKLGNRQYEGIPVLFIPGNSGSYKQVRSLGSVSLQMSYRSPYLFNYFAVDFNEEFYAFYGGTLKRQTEFLHSCIKHINSLYGKRNPSIVLVGHSMGGVIARGVFALPDFNPSLVHTIITQATPHVKPIVPMDFALVEYYDDINAFWKSQRDALLANVTLVSTGGGFRDFQVAVDFTRTEGLLDSKRTFSANTMSIPKAWVSTDHLCAVWCRQVVVLTAKSLYDCVNSSSKELYTSPRKRMDSFKKHFLGVLSPSSKKAISVDVKKPWDVQEDEFVILDGTKVENSRYTVLRLEPEYDSLYAITDMQQPWVFGCQATASESNCVSLESLNHHEKMLPSKEKGSPLLKYILLKGALVKQYSHIVFVVPSAKVMLRGEVFNTKHRQLHYVTPTFLDMVFDIPRSFYVHTDILIASSQPPAMYHQIELMYFYDYYQAYTAEVIIKRKHEQDKGGFMILHHPDVNGQDTLTPVSSSGANLSIRLQFIKADNTRPSQLLLLMDPRVTYSLKVHIDFIGVLSQFSRYYLLYIPSFVVAILIAELIHQYQDGGSSFFLEGTRKFSVLEIVGLVWLFQGLCWLLISSLPSRELRKGSPAESLRFSPIGVSSYDDLCLHIVKGVFALLVPLCLTALAYGAVAVQLGVMNLFLNLIYRLADILGLGSLACTRPGPSTAVAVLRCLISLFALRIGSFAVVAFMYISEVIKIICQPKSVRLNQHKAAPVLLLMLWLFLGTGPGLVSWTKNIKYQYTLTDDPFFKTRLVFIFLLLLVDLPFILPMFFRFFEPRTPDLPYAYPLNYPIFFFGPCFLALFYTNIIIFYNMIAQTLILVNLMRYKEKLLLSVPQEKQKLL